MPVIRTFIALPTQSNVQQRIAEIQQKLKTTQADVKWELQNKFHITLVFLGNIEQSKLELLSAALAKSVQQFSSISIKYESIGAFPSNQNPHIIWIGIKPNQKILDLQTAAARPRRKSASATTPPSPITSSGNKIVTVK